MHRPETPGRGRFHVMPDGRLLVIYHIRGRRGEENRLVEVLKDGDLGMPIQIPLKRPISTFFTASVRAGCAPSNVIDLLADAAGVARYVRIRLR